MITNIFPLIFNCVFNTTKSNFSPFYQISIGIDLLTEMYVLFIHWYLLVMHKLHLKTACMVTTLNPFVYEISVSEGNCEKYSGVKYYCGFQK